MLNQRNLDNSNMRTILGADPFPTNIEIFEDGTIIDENDKLISENTKLRTNLIKLIKSYPKDYIFNRIINDKCPICLNKYKYTEKIALTNCLHIFHKTCIDKSIEGGCLNCPNCRFELENSVFLYINFNLEYKETEFL